MKPVPQLSSNFQAGRARHGARAVSAFAVLAVSCWVLAAAPANAIEWSLRDVFQPKIGNNAGDNVTKPASEAEKPVIFRLHAVRLGKTSRLELTATGPLKADAFLLPDPARVIVDFSNTLFHIQEDAKERAGRKPANVSGNSVGIISSFRYGLLAGGSSRVVIDLKGPAKIAQISTVKIAPSVHRLRIDIEAASVAQFRELARKGQQNAAARIHSAPSSAMVAAGSAAKPVIAIDPGHGGIDSGARTANAAAEKDIVFAFSLELARQLRKQGKFEVVLTRDSDVFVPLRERVEIARRAKAGLLISVHADSLNAKSVQGATVYTVSERASDAHTEKLAEKENQADERAGYKGPTTEAEVSDILFDLTRRETRAFSHVFANSLIAYWQKAGQLNKNPHRSGRFVVLKAQDVPSVLLELGYLSSAADAKLLGDPVWRRKAAGSITQAVVAFFDDRSRRDQAGSQTSGAVSKVAERDGAAKPN